LPKVLAEAVNFEFINSLTIAKAEAEEIKSQLYRGLDIYYFSELLFKELYDMTDVLVRKMALLLAI